MRKLRVLLVCAVSVFAWSGAAAQTSAAVQTRSYASGGFVLELDGLQVGIISGVEGGLPFGDVIKEEAGEESFFKKHLGFPGVRDIHFALGPGMEKSVYNWIGESLRGKASPMSGAVLAVDLQGTIVSRLEFTRAQITEVTIPAADASSKETVRILIGLTPEQTSLNRSPGGSAKVSQKKTKNALSGNFKLSIDGLNTQRVSKIDSLTIKLPFRPNSQGECVQCGDIQAPPPIDFPNVVMTLSQTGSESVDQWFQSFVIHGENDDAKEKNGELSFLASDMQTPLFTIKFNHLGIFELMPLLNEAASSSIARLVASMYCESMEFSGQ
jgi:hypothetical protein